jgi:ankyrin repeat protein
MSYIIKSLLVLKNLTKNTYILLFEYCTQNNIIEFKKLLTSHKNINIHNHNEILFITACKYGHIEIAKYIIEIAEKYSGKKIDIHINNERALVEACRYNKYDIVKYLMTITKRYSGKIFNINTDNEMIFIRTCLCGHLHLTKYLINISINIKTIINIHAGNEYAFKWSNYTNQMEIVKYLQTLGSFCDNIYYLSIYKIIL